MAVLKMLEMPKAFLRYLPCHNKNSLFKNFVTPKHRHPRGYGFFLHTHQYKGRLDKGYWRNNVLKLLKGKIFVIQKAPPRGFIPRRCWFHSTIESISLSSCSVNLVLSVILRFSNICSGLEAPIKTLVMPSLL